MFRKDFETGNFPIGSLSPVLALGRDGTMSMAYTRTGLRELANWGELDKLIGIWPGKKSTDFFTLSPESYKGIAVPPQEYENIDTAESIKVVFADATTFLKITYRLPGQDAEMVSKSAALLEYIKKGGLQHKVVYEDF